MATHLTLGRTTSRNRRHVKGGGRTKRLMFETLEDRNLLAGGVANLSATDGDDTISIDVGANYVVTINGASQSFDPASIGEIHIDAKAGQDSIVINGGSSDETAHLQVGSVEFTAADYEFTAQNVETIRLFSGSGGMDLSGETKKFSGDVSGSGDIRAMNLKSEESDLQVSGSGNIDVYASIKLDASISGSGDVRYKGDAKVNRSTSGSGDVRKVD